MRAPARKAYLVERASRLRRPFCAATVASERTISILPCRLLDDVLPVYDALAFEVTYRQARPNPYAVVCLVTSSCTSASRLSSILSGPTAA